MTLIQPPCVFFSRPRLLCTVRDIVVIIHYLTLQLHHVFCAGRYSFAANCDVARAAGCYARVRHFRTRGQISGFLHDSDPCSTSHRHLTRLGSILTQPMSEALLPSDSCEVGHSRSSFRQLYCHLTVCASWIHWPQVGSLLEGKIKL